MTNLPEEGLTPKEELRASTELLRLKLQLEHGMTISDTSELPPEIENKWLSNIYDFEKNFKEASMEKIYDILGKPLFKKWDTMTATELDHELNRILALMEEKHIQLDCCCDYSNELIYRFITEELFEHETDNVIMEGMVHHFIYEEFHPNHDYDLRNDTRTFVDSILKRSWKEEFDAYKLGKKILFNQKEYNPAEISAIILEFQRAHSFFELEKFEVLNIVIDLPRNRARTEVRLTYIAHSRQNGTRIVAGPCTFDFHHDCGDWDLTGFTLPGLTR